MPLPIVAIEAENSQLGPDARQTIVASCSGVLGAASCVGGEDPLAPAARYVALILPGSEAKLRVALRRRADDAPQGLHTLAFASPTLGLEHWNSTGLIVAALVADAEQSTPPPARTPEKPPAKAHEPPAQLWLKVGAGVVASPGFDFDPWRIGPYLRVAGGKRNFPLYPVLALRWVGASGRVRSDALSGALGVGAQLVGLGDQLELDLELSAVTDALLVSAGTEQGFSARYGARAGLASAVKLGAFLQAVVGVDTTWLAARTSLELDGQRLGAEPHFWPGFEAGLRLAF